MNYRGRISRIVGNEVYVQISTLAVDQDFGPMEMMDTGNLAVDDYVLVAQVDGAAEDVIIIGKLLQDLSEVGSAIPLPTTNDSFLVGQSTGAYAWKTTAQTKTALGVDTLASGLSTAQSNITTLQSEVQPVNRGGTGKTSYTTGNYIQATASTTLSERTPTQVKSDIGLANVNNTSDASKPVSTAQQAALDLKRNLAPTSFSTGQDFNTLTTPGEYVWTAGFGSNTNAPETNQGILTVFGSTTTMLQRFASITTLAIYERIYNGTTWSSWVRITRSTSSWTDITFADSDWVAYGSLYQNPQYKIEDTRVKLRGLLKSNIARSGTTPCTTMFASNAPLANAIFWQGTNAAGATGAASTGTAHTHPYPSGGSSSVRVDVTSGGNVNLMLDGGRTLPVSGWLSLDGITWDTN